MLVRRAAAPARGRQMQIMLSSCQGFSMSSHAQCLRDHMQVVCAGSLDTFQIFVWSIKTGRLLEILAAHEGPVVGLAFDPHRPVLASVSWDRTLRTWDVFSGKGRPLLIVCFIVDVLLISCSS